MSEERKKAIFVITGPSGCGKSTLIKRVLRRNRSLRFSVSHTSRKKRPQEVHGRDYYFVSEKVFRRKAARGEFVEWAVVHGSLYGTSRKELEKRNEKRDLLLDIDVQGARLIRGKIKEAVFIFILPPLYKELKKRLEERETESPSAVQRRLATAKKEIRSFPLFDFLVVNDDLQTAVRELESIIRSQRCRLEMRKKEVAPILRSFGLGSRFLR